MLLLLNPTTFVDVIEYVATVVPVEELANKIFMLSVESNT